jgi:hypothetical protein
MEDEEEDIMGMEISNGADSWSEEEFTKVTSLSDNLKESLSPPAF